MAHQDLCEKKFQIVEKSQSYEPEKLSESMYLSEACKTTILTDQKEDNHKVYILDQAKTQICNFIGWGRDTINNQVEQGGILIGNSYYDKNINNLFGIVRFAIAGKSAKGFSAYLDLNHSAWKEMLDGFDEITEQYPNDKLQIIGWFHTHPKSLSVFMSATDRATQAHFFDKTWQLAIVLNPHTQIWKSFYGKHSIECTGTMLNENKGEYRCQSHLN